MIGQPGADDEIGGTAAGDVDHGGSCLAALALVGLGMGNQAAGVVVTCQTRRFWRRHHYWVFEQISGPRHSNLVGADGPLGFKVH
jgi:hypothetical protein